MKKLFAFTRVVLLCLFALSADFASAKPFEHNAKLKPALEDELITKERQVWEAYRVRDGKALSQLLAEDFYAIEDVDGEIMTKKEALESLSGLDLKNFQMENFKVIKINDGSAIVRYKVKVTGEFKRHPMTSHWSMVSSVWVKRGGKWQNLSYQETWIDQGHAHAAPTK
ncbi:MAG: nuclear transport factor 2 family protein [Verrucomicrobiota bacterium]